MPVRREKGSGRFLFEFDRRIAGQRVRVTKTLPKGWSQAQADAYDRTESARLYAEATGVAPPRVTIETAVETYLSEHAKDLDGYDNLVREFAQFAWCYMGRTLEDLPAVAREYKEHAEKTPSERTSRPLSPVSIGRRIAYLRAACRYYWKSRRLTIVDPAHGLYMPDGHDQLRDQYMTRAEMLRIARKMTLAHNRALLILGFYCGTRKGELWKAVVHDTFLQLPSNTTKTDRPRIVPVLPKAQRWLRYLPPRVTYHGYGKNFQRARERAGLQGLRFNDARHGAATAMVNSGESLYIVGKILGHTDTRTTERYAQAELGPMAAAVAKIGRKGLGNS